MPHQKIHLFGQIRLVKKRAFLPGWQNGLAFSFECSQGTPARYFDLMSRSLIVFKPPNPQKVRKKGFFGISALGRVETAKP